MLRQTRDLQGQYDSLKPRQQAIIDAHAELESQEADPTNRAKAERAAEILGDTVNESYCSQIINRQYPDIAEWRRRQEAGETVDRDAPVAAEVVDDGVLLHMEKAYLRERLEAGDLPKEMLDAVLETVFND